MSVKSSNSEVAYTAAESNEAAVWIARLHAPDRTTGIERGFRRWLTESPSHAAAFEAISSTWELIGAIERRPFPKLTRWQRMGYREGFLRSAAAVCIAVALVLVGALLYLRPETVATGVGEQRTVTLEDGSGVTLNASSRIVVRYNSRQRQVDLESGEAIFQVAKRGPTWPFVVIARGTTVTAWGTEFDVQEDPQRLSITLIEGKVVVAPAGQETAPEPSDILTLAPGQRVTFVRAAPAKIDRPALRAITAWGHRQLEFKDIPLSEAAAEMNQNSALKLSVERPATTELRVNGVFRAGDTASFADAVAQSYGLGVVRGAHTILLTGLPVRRPTASPQSR